jgi:xylulokinase
MIRALMEGVAYDLRQSLACFRALQLPIDEIRLGEGGVKSILWRQILVDAFGQNGRLMELGDASAVGAAIIAGVGVGLFDSFETGCDRCIGIGDTVHFEDSNARIYDRQFEKYDRLYPALKPWFAQNF